MDCDPQLIAMGTELSGRTNNTCTAGRPRVVPTLESMALAICSASTSGAHDPSPPSNNPAALAWASRARHDPGDWNASGMARTTLPPNTTKPARLPVFSNTQNASNRNA